jgi:hypothetical protein
MMNVLGYGNRSKFLRRLQEWQDLWGKIPLIFLEMLAISKADILSVLEFDKQDFFETVKHANRPKCFQYRIIPAVYPVKRLPDGTTEAEAVLHAVTFLKSQPEHIQRSGAWINYGGLKTVFIDADGTMSTRLYVPAIVFQGPFAIFKTASMPCTVTLR